MTTVLNTPSLMPPFALTLGETVCLLIASEQNEKAALNLSATSDGNSDGGSAGSLAELAQLLCKRYPEVDLASADSSALAVICLFLHGQQSYLLIDSPESFVEQYAGQLAYEPADDNAPVTAADFPEYDTEEIRLPVLSDKQLIFYAQAVTTGVPYRVAASWPGEDSSEPVKFSLLALAADSLQGDLSEPT